MKPCQTGFSAPKHRCAQIIAWLHKFRNLVSYEKDFGAVCWVIARTKFFWPENVCVHVFRMNAFSTAADPVIGMSFLILHICSSVCILSMVDDG